MKKYFRRRIAMFLGVFFFCTLVGLSTSYAARHTAFGISSNDTNETLQIEEMYGIRSGVVGYIFDSFSRDDASFLKNSIQLLGEDRVYHITISPYGFSAKEVADGFFDDEYRRFFRLVKESNTHFLFRTMHEMNGSWYSWSMDPDAYKAAWKRIYRLSREEGLSTEKNPLYFLG